MKLRLVVMLFALSYGEMVSASISYETISSPGKLTAQGLAKRGDAIFFDLDGVLLSEGGAKGDANLLPDALDIVKTLNARGVFCYGLTARSEVNMLETYNLLNRYGIQFSQDRPFLFENSQAKFYRGIIFSPNIHEQQEKTSTKLLTLVSFVNALGLDKQQIFYVDNENFHLEQSKDVLGSYQDQCQFFHLIRDFQPVYSTLKSPAPSLKDLQYIECKEGGTGGVVVLKDQSGKKWTLKGWANKAHGLNECLAAVLYEELGGNCPSFYLYDDIPASLKSMGKINQGGLYRLAEYVEGCLPRDELLKTKLDQSFVLLAFLSYWDVHPKNFVLKADESLHLIDTGGALLYRSLGSHKASAQKNWQASQVTELSSFKMVDHLAHNIFEDKNLKNCLPQIKHILDHKQNILSRVRQFCTRFNYDEEADLLHMVEGRLNHLQLLYDFHSGRLNTQADPFLKSTQLDSAGTLIYADYQGKPHVLIGKRCGHQWWGNLGGKSDAGEYLYETAAREVYEESGKIINLGEQIKFCPSHDTLFVEKEGTAFRHFRTYLVKHDYVDPETIKNGEYTEYKWVPMAEIMEGTWIEEENTRTLQLKDGTILHPPFVDSLLQEQNIQWFNAILNNKEVASSCTQSVVGHKLQPYSQENTTEEADHQRFVLAMSEMAKNRKVVPTQVSALPAGNFKTASASMLTHLLGGATEDDQVSRIMKVVNTSESCLKIDEAQAKIVSDIIDVEKQHKDMHVLYSGMQSDIWFCYRVLSLMRHMLDQSPVQTDTLRSLDTFFDRFPTAADLLDYILSGKNNYSEGFKSVGMSCNPTLLSNLKRDTCCTLDYFFKGNSFKVPGNIWNILDAAFSEIQIDKNAIESMKSIYNRIFSNKIGCLLQVFFKPSVTNQICYPCITMGRTLMDGNGKVARDSAAILEELKQGLSQMNLVVSSEKIQFRLHTDLSRFSVGSVIVRDYFSDGNTTRLQELDAEVNKILVEYLNRALFKAASNPSIYKSRLPALIKIAVTHRDIQSTLKRKNIPYKPLEFINAYLEDPTILEKAVFDPDTLGDMSLLKSLLPKIGMQKTKIALWFIKHNWTEDLVVAVLSVVNDLGPNAGTVIELSKTLIKDHMLGYDVFHILKTLDDLGPNAGTVIELSKTLIKDHMDGFNVSQILEAVSGLGPDAQRVIELSKTFIKDSSYGSCISSILTAVNGLGPNADAVIELSKTLIQDQMLGDDISHILKTLDNLGPNAGTVIELSRTLINDFSYGICISSILTTVNDLGSDAQRVIELSKILIKDHMNGFNVSQILEAVSGLGPDAQRIVSLSKPFIKDRMFGDEISQILTTVNGLGSDAQRVIDLSRPFIQERMSGSIISGILEAVKVFGSDAQRVIQLSKPFIGYRMSRDDVLCICKAVKGLGPDAERVIELNKAFIKDHMNGYQISFILSFGSKAEEVYKSVMALSSCGNISLSGDDFIEISHAIYRLGANAETIVNACLLDIKDGMDLTKILEILNKHSGEFSSSDKQEM